MTQIATAINAIGAAGLYVSRDATDPSTTEAEAALLGRVLGVTVTLDSRGQGFGAGLYWPAGYFHRLAMDALLRLQGELWSEGAEDLAYEMQDELETAFETVWYGEVV